MRAKTVSFLALVALAGAANAATVVVDAVNSGWYTASGLANGTLNNIFTGNDGPNYRDWLGFNLSGVSGTITAGSVLELASDPRNAGGPQTIDWWDATADYRSGHLGKVNSISIYNDLGSGTLVASGIQTAGTLNIFNLNAAGLASLNSAEGSSWAVGGQNLTGDQAFGYTLGVGSGDQIELVLTVGSASAPDGCMTLGMLGMAVSGLAFIRRRI